MYTITVFPDAVLRTGTSDDKRRAAPFATYGELRTLDTFADVVHTASSMTVSLNEYSASEKCKPGQVHRTGSHFIRTNLIGLDVDDNMSMAEAKSKLALLGFRYGLYTSFNHDPGVAEKFRIILELEELVEDESTYRATWEAVHKQFLGIDTSCKDTARLYYHSNPSTREVAIIDGKLVPVVYESLPEEKPKRWSTQPTEDGWEEVQLRSKLTIEVRNWLTGIDEYGEPWTPEPGERSALFYKFTKLCKERGYDREWCNNMLGARLRNDPDYLRKYGGYSGVQEKIEATLEQVFSKESRHSKPDLFTAESLSDARLFVSDWMGSRQLQVNTKGLLCRGSSSWTVLQLSDTIKLDYERHCNEFQLSQAHLDKAERKKVKKIGASLLESALREHVRVHRDKHRRILLERIRYNGDKVPTELQKFVLGLTGKSDPVVEAVLAHFIWQVKRKAYGLPVQYHMMPIVTGPQGNGKSTAVKRLLAPLADFIATPSLSELADKRNFEAFQYNYIAFCDELQNAEKTDVEGLKNFITADRQTAREMYSTTQVEFRQNCTPIGCSNRSLATLIYDPTGMRRFFEIVTDEKLRGEGWSVHDTVDFAKLWQQIDENRTGKAYLEEAWSQIVEAQEQLRTQDPIEAFLEESGAGLTEGCATIQVKTRDFYNDYRLYCNLNGHQYRHSNWFGTKLREYHIIKRQKWEDGEKVNVYVVNSTYKPMETP
jgi:hypothetical protein